MKKNIISPSVLACDLSNLEKETEKVRKAGAEYIHLDVMDGHFVPNISLGVPVISSLRKRTDIIFDVHLMLSDPLKYIETFVNAGADIITFHVECDSDIKNTIKEIKSYGKKVGISLKPGTGAKDIFPYLEMIDMVLVMTVEPGFGGQNFIPEMIQKISEIRKEIEARNLDVDIQVDGGINEDTIKLASSAGANVFVAGSSVFNAENTEEAIKSLLIAANSD